MQRQPLLPGKRSQTLRDPAVPQAHAFPGSTPLPSPAASEATSGPSPRSAGVCQAPWSPCRPHSCCHFRGPGGSRPGRTPTLDAAPRRGEVSPPWLVVQRRHPRRASVHQSGLLPPSLSQLWHQRGGKQAHGSGASDTNFFTIKQCTDSKVSPRDSPASVPP